VIVGSDNKVISVGYNGYPHRVDETKMPQTRPEKYPPILHADENAILNSNKSLDGATMYITGTPCIHCWAQIIQKNIGRVVYGPVGFHKDSPFNNLIPEEHELLKDMLENHNIEIVKWIPQSATLIMRELEEIMQLVIENQSEEEQRVFDRLHR
jgi:dCMP deaminase